MDINAFDPLKTPVSWNPIRDLRQIASRARVLLSIRPVSEIREAQRQITDFRESAFEETLESAVNEEKGRLRKLALYDGDEDALRFFELSYIDSDGERWDFRRGMEDELEDLPNIDDLTRLEWVLEMVRVGLPVGIAGLETWTESDFLAAHALALIEEVESILSRIAEPEPEDLDQFAACAELQASTNRLLQSRRMPVPQHVPTFPESLIRDAFTLAMEALDAVGKAELHQSASSAGTVSRYLSALMQLANEEAEAEREKRKAAAHVAVNQLHALNRELKNRVLQEWDRDRSRFASAEKAGDYFASWLEEQGHKFQQRTVRDWIRAHAKKNGVALR